MTDLIIAATGHRPDKLLAVVPRGHYPRLMPELTNLATLALKRFRPSEVISGMALGWDTAVALAAVKLDIPFTAACPFRGQESTWPGRDQIVYRDLLTKATRVVFVCNHRLNIAFQERNEWMVDRANLMLALHDGSPGGTNNCLEYANRYCQRVENLWDEWAASWA